MIHHLETFCTHEVVHLVVNVEFDVCRVIPQALLKRGVFGNKIADFVAVDNMHRRKWLPEMIRLADAFLALPGIFIHARCPNLISIL